MFTQHQVDCHSGKKKQNLAVVGGAGEGSEAVAPLLAEVARLRLKLLHAIADTHTCTHTQSTTDTQESGQAQAGTIQRETKIKLKALVVSRNNWGLSQEYQHREP